jgi:hypothetical protein
VYIRLNLKSGNSKWYFTELSAWYTHPTDASIDVAILNVGVPEECDHLVIPSFLGLTEAKSQEHEIGLGDEVFITGLFRHHHGSNKNIPIVRVGNLACLDEEHVVTSLGEMDAYLIEARSIGGLSGSPVFLNLGIIRMVKGQIVHATKGPIILFMGLIHGHFDVKTNAVDMNNVLDGNGLTTEQINTGVAIVVPFRVIEKVLLAFEAQQPA